MSHAVLKPPKEQGKNFKAVQSRIEFLDQLIQAFPPAPQHGLAVDAVLYIYIYNKTNADVCKRMLTYGVVM